MTRLIDADSVEKVLTDLYIKRPLDSDRWVIGAIESGIRKLPTIDAVPVKRGLWLPTYEDHGFDDEVKNLALACSVCQVAFPISDYAQIEDFRYCPNCGARMDEE